MQFEIKSIKLDGILEPNHRPRKIAIESLATIPVIDPKIKESL